jgi:CubicO group peptidase (beta-lactamase class C family)
MCERQLRVERGLVMGPEARPSEVTDSLVLDRMALYGVPGMSVAVIDGGEIAWTESYGVASGDQETPVTASTLFQCCSISKTVASLVALRLVGLGETSLDTDVNSILHEWKLRDAHGKLASVTLRQVLSHTGGINVHGAPGYPPGSAVPTLDDVLEGVAPAITAPVRVTSEPGRTYRYSAGGYCVLQKVIEIITGQSYSDAARALVLAPLRMRDSTFEQPLPPDLWDRGASAHLTLSRTPCHERWFVYPEQAVGGLWTTARDLAQIVIEVQKASTGEGSVLDQRLAAEMLRQHSTNYNVGLGTYISNHSDPSAAYFSHLGAHLGWHAVLMGYIELGMGAVILTNNGYTGAELYREVLLSIRNEYGWPRFDGSFS